MKLWEPATREFVRVFFAHNQHIAIVSGRKPRRFATVDLIRTNEQSKVPTFTIAMHGEKPSLDADQEQHDRYYLVKPLFPGPARSHINIRHFDGTDRLRVEELPLIADAGLVRTDTDSAPNSTTTQREQPGTALGYSQNFSMDEAFTDALSHLPKFERRHRDRRVTVVDVVSMGAIYGGFSGFSRLFVKVEQSTASMLPPAIQKKLKGKPIRN